MFLFLERKLSLLSARLILGLKECRSYNILYRFSKTGISLKSETDTELIVCFLYLLFL